MRIISGSARGRRLHAPPPRSRSIRPTSDRAREALFSIITPDFVVGARVLDLFAGTGALGCEALSRGARHCHFIDSSRSALELVQLNVGLVPGGSERATILRYDLRNGLDPRVMGDTVERFDLVFADPPYQKDLSGKIVRALDNSDVLSETVLVIIEEKKGVKPPEGLKILGRTDFRTYGDTAFALYRRSRSS